MGVSAAIFPDHVQPVFVWGREHCTKRIDAEWHEDYYIKDLRKIKRLGYDLKRMWIVDDTPKKVERHYGNAVYVTPFYGDTTDNELEQLAAYLPTLASEPNVRVIEKRGWRHRRA